MIHRSLGARMTDQVTTLGPIIERANALSQGAAFELQLARRNEP